MKFDLNIDNYTIEDILDIFDLTENYDANMLDIKEIKMRDNIMRSTELGQHDIDRTIQFLQDAKLILMNAKDNNNASTTTTATTTATATIATTGTMNNLLSSFENNASKYTPLKDESEHMVQDKKNNGNYISSYPSSFFNGVINPLMKKVRYMNINIDSRFRSNYYSQSSSNFNANIAEQINGVLTMQLQSIELPTTFYTISKQLDNNYFYIDLPNTNDSGLVEIQEGNYDYLGIEDAINTALTNLGGDYANIVFKINSTDKSNGVGNGSGRMLVGLSSTPTAPIPSDFKYSLNFQKSKAGLENDLTALPLKLGWLLGFRNGKYTDNLNYASEGVVDLLGLKYMYLSIDDYNNNVNNSFHSAFTSSLLNKNILARISIKSGTTNIISQDNLNITTTPREYYGPVNINNLHVQLLDPYGRAVDLNNMDYSFCLTLQLVYDI